MAAVLEVTRAKINAFENGVNSNPTVADLGKFTGYFKISVDSLLCKFEATDGIATAQSGSRKR